MKFRIIYELDEITVITEDGGVACIREAEPIDNEPRIATTDYYQSKISNDMNRDNLFECLGEGKMYCKDWADVKYNSLTAIQDALDWLCVGQKDWEISNDLYQHVFDTKLIKNKTVTLKCDIPKNMMESTEKQGDLGVLIETGITGLAISFDGYSGLESDDKILIEHLDGQLRVILWANPHQKEPSQIVSLPKNH